MLNHSFNAILFCRRVILHCVMVIGYNFYWQPIVAINCNVPHQYHYQMKHLNCLVSVVNKAWLHHSRMVLVSYAVSIVMFVYSFILPKFWTRYVNTTFLYLYFIEHSHRIFSILMKNIFVFKIDTRDSPW